MNAGRDIRLIVTAVATMVAMGATGPAALAQGAAGAAGGRGGAATADTTRGFAINDAKIIQHCARCHRRDSTGIMQRVSFERKTPEGWEISIRRMTQLNKVEMPAADP